MKSFQPKAANAPPDDSPDISPSSDTTDSSKQTQSETAPMSHRKYKNRNVEVDFRGEKRSNATHASATDPDARLFKKSAGTGAMSCFMGHTLMENRNGLIVQADLTRADRHAETQGMKCASTAKRFQKHWATKVFALRLGHISIQLFLEKMPDIFDVFGTKRLRRRAKLNPNAILRPEDDLAYAHYATKNMDLTEGLDSKNPEYVQLCVRKHALSF